MRSSSATRQPPRAEPTDEANASRAPQGAVNVVEHVAVPTTTVEVTVWPEVAFWIVNVAVAEPVASVVTRTTLVRRP